MIVKSTDYVLKNVPAPEQKIFVAEDFEGIKFEITYNEPTARQLLEIESNCVELSINDKGEVFSKTSITKKIEYILKNLVVCPQDLTIDHLTVSSSKELSDTFRKLL